MEPFKVRSLVAGAAGAAVGVVAVAGLDGAVAGRAQRAGARYLAAVNGGPPWTYSLWKHVVAMVLLAVLTVAVAGVLGLAGNRVLGAGVLVAVAAGPMTVIAAPVRKSLITPDFQDTVLGWHLLVGGSQLMIMAVACWWMVRCLQRPDPAAGPVTVPSSRRSLLALSVSSVFGVYAAVAVTVQIVGTPNAGTSEHPGLLPVIGWAVLGAGIAVIVARSTGRWDPAGMLLAGVVVLAALCIAYVRPGGWPGVAGWEFGGMESPIILSPVSALVFLSGPVLGLIVQAGRRTAGTGRRYRPAVRLGDPA